MCAAFTEGVFCLFFIFVKCPLLPELPIPKVTLLTSPSLRLYFTLGPLCSRHTIKQACIICVRNQASWPIRRRHRKVSRITVCFANRKYCLLSTPGNDKDFLSAAMCCFMFVLYPCLCIVRVKKTQRI